MQKPNKARQAKDLARGKKKAKKELKKKRANKVKLLKRKADAIEERKIKNETFKMEQEIKKLQNKGLTIRKDSV
jgi:hypothetical protein